MVAKSGKTVRLISYNCKQFYLVISNFVYILLCFSYGIMYLWQPTPSGAAELVWNILDFQKDQDVRFKVGYEIVDKVFFIEQWAWWVTDNFLMRVAVSWVRSCWATNEFCIISILYMVRKILKMIFRLLEHVNFRGWKVWITPCDFQNHMIYFLSRI